jgi:hypothetical protein
MYCNFFCIQCFLANYNYPYRKSLQSTIETVVQEIHKILQLQPALVMVTKSPIYGEGTTAVNDFNRYAIIWNHYSLNNFTL